MVEIRITIEQFSGKWLTFRKYKKEKKSIHKMFYIKKKIDSSIFLNIVNNIILQNMIHSDLSRSRDLDINSFFFFFNIERLIFLECYSFSTELLNLKITIIL